MKKTERFGFFSEKAEDKEDQIRIIAERKPGEAEGCFSLGFGECGILSRDAVQGKARLSNGAVAQGVLDTPKAHAVFLDDCTGAGSVILLSVDVHSFSTGEVDRIRSLLEPLCRSCGCSRLFICGTGTASGPEVSEQGLKRNEPVYSGIVSAVRMAVDCQRKGLMYFGSIDVPRLPDIVGDETSFTSKLYRLRFVPFDKSRQTIITVFGLLPDTLGNDNNLFSADFPAYLSLKLNTAMGADSVYFTGALHDFDRHRSKDKNKVESAKVIGRRLADYVMAVENERLIEPSLALKTAAFELPTDNPFFRRAARAQRRSGSVYCELSMAMLFDLPILFSPFLISDEFFSSDRAVFDEPPVVISFAGAYAGIASAQAENGSEEGRTHFGVGEALCSESGEYLMRAVECVSDVMTESSRNDMS